MNKINVAKEINRIYNASLIYDADGENGNNVIGFICPECEDPIYFEDYDVFEDNPYDFSICPVCEEKLL